MQILPSIPYLNGNRGPQDTNLVEMSAVGDNDKKVVEKDIQKYHIQSSFYPRLLCTALLCGALYHIISTQKESNSIFKETESLGQEKSTNFFERLGLSSLNNEKQLNFSINGSLLFLYIFAIGVLYKKVENQYSYNNIQSEYTKNLENRIDRMEMELSELRGSINNSTVFNGEEIPNKPIDLKEYGFNLEELHKSIPDEFFLTDINWVDGVHRRESGFFIKKCDEFIKAYQPGNSVKFANGEIREITSAVSNNDTYLNIFLKGDPLIPSEVGLPSQYSVLIPEENHLFNKPIDAVA